MMAGGWLDDNLLIEIEVEDVDGVMDGDAEILGAAGVPHGDGDAVSDAGDGKDGREVQGLPGGIDAEHLAAGKQSGGGFHGGMWVGKQNAEAF